MLRKSSISQTLKVFFNKPTMTLNLKEVSLITKIAHTSIKKNLIILKNKNLIIETIDKKGKRKYPLYKANLDSKKFIKLKKINNLSELINSGLIEFIGDKIMPKSIVLFGSYSRGEDIETSDIDLFIESKEINLDLVKFEKKMNRKVEIHFKENLLDYPKELKNNIINGIVLDGFIEVFK